MRLHTNLTHQQLRAALVNAKAKGNVGNLVHFADTNGPATLSVWSASKHRSRSHDHAFEVQLGSAAGNGESLPANAVNAYGKPQKARQFRSSSRYSSSLRFAATYSEWGWFMAEVYALDQHAVFGSVNAATLSARKYRQLGISAGAYNGVDDFNEQTNNKFRL